MFLIKTLLIFLYLIVLRLQTLFQYLTTTKITTKLYFYSTLTLNYMKSFRGVQNYYNLKV